MEDQIRELNARINWYDPPKDLDIIALGGGKLSNTNPEHQRRLISCMNGLFDKTIAATRYGGTLAQIQRALPNWTSVGARSNKILDTIQGLYGTNLDRLNHVNIIREKHSSGHSSRPSNLRVMQDCGPVDVVVNPTLVITPGSIIDPAGKTKTGALNLIDNPVGTVLTLELEYINTLA
jgi:hypothetical protein